MEYRPLRRSTTAACLAVLLIPALAVAQPFGPGGHHRGFGPGGDRLGSEGMIERLAVRLELTEDQQEELRGVFEQHRDALELQGQATREARRALAEQIRAEALDEAAIREIAARLGEAEGELAISRGQIHHQLRLILMPDQLERLDEIRGRFGGPAAGRKSLRFHRQDAAPGEG